jgi:DNA-binding transcriptional regulator YbjK
MSHFVGLQEHSGMARSDGAKTVEQGIEKLTRRELIADAVIHIMGEKGVREVTHRKVDQFLGLREGSTSPYFPKVFDLLNAGLSRLSEHDADALRKVYDLVMAWSQGSGSLDPGEIAGILQGVWREASKPQHRYLLVARFEFVLLADRQAEFKESNTRYFENLMEVDTLLFEKMGAENPAAAAWEYGVFRRGLWFTLLIAPPGRSADVPPGYFEAHIRRIIRETDGQAHAGPQLGAEFPPPSSTG